MCWTGMLSKGLCDVVHVLVPSHGRGQKAPTERFTSGFPLAGLIVTVWDISQCLLSQQRISHLPGAVLVLFALRSLFPSLQLSGRAAAHLSRLSCWGLGKVVSIYGKVT